MNKYEKALNSIAMQSPIGIFDYEIGCILELVERAKPKKVEYKKCKCGIKLYPHMNFCHNCGQALGGHKNE